MAGLNTVYLLNLITANWRDEFNTPIYRVRNGCNGQRVAVQIAVVGKEFRCGNERGHILRSGEVVIFCLRRVVDGIHRDRHRGDVRARVVVLDGIVKTIAAEEIGCRRIGCVAIGSDRDRTTLSGRECSRYSHVRIQCTLIADRERTAVVDASDHIEYLLDVFVGCVILIGTDRGHVFDGHDRTSRTLSQLHQKRIADSVCVDVVRVHPGIEVRRRTVEAAGGDDVAGGIHCDSVAEIISASAHRLCLNESARVVQRHHKNVHDACAG